MKFKKKKNFNLFEADSLIYLNPSLKSSKGVLKLFSFIGPAFLVAIGYMDPGNWSTDLQGGAQFGYKLIYILLMSNLMAIFLQYLAAKLGVVKELDLAQATCLMYPKLFKIGLYILAELSIIATDIAEIIGMSIGLNLLFGIPEIWGLVIAIADTFIFLFLVRLGIRVLEAFFLVIIATILGCFVYMIFLSKPNTVEVLTGFIPTQLSANALYISLGIIGATVMPHNLYLHSSLVQTRVYERTEQSIKKALKFNLIDSIIALNFAFFINAAILILAASTFFNTIYQNVAGLHQAHSLLDPILGSSMAGILFAIALIAAGQSSSITGTLSGQIVMEGFINLKIKPWQRRLFTRLLAAIPTIFIVLYFGEEKIEEILVFSQVFLSIQLALTIIPLIHFVSLKKYMADYAISKFQRTIAWIIASVLLYLNLHLVFNTLFSEGAFNWLYLLLALLYIFFLVFSFIYPLKANRLKTH